MRCNGLADGTTHGQLVQLLVTHVGAPVDIATAAAAHASCLERALVLQAWYSAYGTLREVVIGVASPEELTAHAWLDGDAECHEAASWRSGG